MEGVVRKAAHRVPNAGNGTTTIEPRRVPLLLTLGIFTATRPRLP
jgi:hypothetical protein